MRDKTQLHGAAAPRSNKSVWGLYHDGGAWSASNMGDSPVPRGIKAGEYPLEHASGQRQTGSVTTRGDAPEAADTHWSLGAREARASLPRGADTSSVGS